MYRLVQSASSSHRSLVILWTALAIAHGAVGLATTRVAGQDFRVETDVFADDAKEPIVQNLTLFAGGVIYDFLLTEPEEVTLLDLSRARLVLLSPGKKLRTDLPTDQVLKFVAMLKTQSPSARLVALIDPQFEESYDEMTHRLRLTSKHVIYEVKYVEPKATDAARRYQEFADWYARLNSMRPDNPPPFGRIRLNKVLADKNLMPEEVTRTVVMKSGLLEKRYTATSRHLVNWQLTNTDRKRIDDVGEYLTSFRSVPFRDYRQLSDPSSRGE